MSQGLTKETINIVNNIFTNGPFLPLSGGTITGNTLFTLNLSASTFYSASTPFETIIYNIANSIAIPGFSGWTSSTGSNSIVANNGIGNSASGNFSIAGGYGSIASGNTSFIGNGKLNKTYGSKSFIGNGYNNLASGAQSFIGNGQQNKALGDYSIIVGGGFNTASTFYSTIVGGQRNISTGWKSFIGGGLGNSVTQNGGVVGGGYYNIVSAVKSFIGGGEFNRASGYYTVVGGGQNNTASGQFSSVLGGSGNTASGKASSVIGGFGNIVTGINSAIIGGGYISGTSNDTVYMPNARLAEMSGSIIYSAGTPLQQIFATISMSGGTSANIWSGSTGANSIIANNGTGNLANGSFSIAAGSNNVVTKGNSSILGGKNNRAYGYYSSVVGGVGNSATTYYSFVGGGRTNRASAYDSFVGGGRGNIANGYGSTIVGGNTNTSNGQLSFIGGGIFNSATTSYAVVVGGWTNLASGNESFVGGGRNNISSGIRSFVGGGGVNTSSGNFSSIIGGTSNIASGIASSILAGTGHTVTGRNSAVIGGGSISGTADDMVYVPHLNIQNLSTGTSINTLGIDASGNVVSAATSSGGGTFTGGTVSGATIFTGGLSANTLYNTFGLDMLDMSLDVLSTGVETFTGLSINSPSTFNIAPVVGYIIDGINKKIIYSGQTGITATYLTAATETYILLTSGLTIQQQITYPTSIERRQNIYLGQLGHGTRTSLLNVFNEPDIIYASISQLRDIMVPIHLINDGIGNSPNGVNMNFNTSSGTLYGMGIGFVSNILSPSTFVVSGQSPTSFQYRTQTGGTGTTITTINPTVYDVGGFVTSLPFGPNISSNQRIYILQNGIVRVQYGQTTYTTLANAIAGIDTETFVKFPNFNQNAILIGILSVKNGATDLSNINDARFSFVSKFGEVVGGTGGIATTTLQQAYNNSVTPEIIINPTLDGLTIQNGTGNADNVTNLLEGKNSGGTTNSFIRADGAISGSSFLGVTKFIGAGFDGQGGILSTGATVYRVIRDSGIITGWDLVISPSGTCIFDVWKIGSGQTLPTISNVITDLAKPQITDGVWSGATSVPTWSATTINPGDIIGIVINSCTGATFGTLNLTYIKNS